MSRRDLLLLLPGAYFQPGDYAANGMMAALPSSIETVEVPPCPQRYLDGDIGPWLHRTYVAPAAGRRIFMLGISLGAMGALMHAQAHPGTVDGMVLLSPFLGTRGLIAEAVAAGGLRAWQPGTLVAGDIERRMLAGVARLPPQNLHLGCGRADRFADASRLLASLLAPSRVFWTDGGHDWDCWRALWSQILRSGPYPSWQLGEAS
jgi:enterochelin esterase-like enzyme